MRGERLKKPSRSFALVVASNTRRPVDARNRQHEIDNRDFDDERKMIMAWYDYIPSVPFQIGNAIAGGKPMGVSKDTLLGGTSKKPGEFYNPYPHESEILGAIRGGMNTNRTAPQVGMDSPFRTAQLNQLGQLQGLANGTQKTAGELAAMRGAQQAAAQQQAMARMARGGDAALAQRTAANQVAGISSNAAGQAQRSALEGQMQAQGLLTQAMQAGRGQDVQVQIANMDSQLRQLGMDDAARLAYLSQLTGMDANTLQIQMGQYQAAQQKQGLLGPLLSAGGQIGAAYAGKPPSMPMSNGGYGGTPGFPSNPAPYPQQPSGPQAGSGIGSGNDNFGLYSDERLKTDISDAGNEIDEMLDGLVAKRYRYKDSRHGEGSRVGFMAQDLQRSSAGRDIVMEARDGKAIDVNKAVSAALASAARLNERVRELERERSDDARRTANSVLESPAKAREAKASEPRKATKQPPTRRKGKWSAAEHRRSVLEKHRGAFVEDEAA